MVDLGNFVELWISTSFTFWGCISCRIFVDFVYIIKVFQSRYLKKVVQEVSSKINEGALVMGIHYDYNPHVETRLWKKRLNVKLELNKEGKKLSTNPKENKQETMHDINKPITEDLTNQTKRIIMKLW